VTCSECTNAGCALVPGAGPNEDVPIRTRHTSAQWSIKRPSFASYSSPKPPSCNSQLSHQLVESIEEMALAPVLNSGTYTIRNVQNGSIRDSDGSLYAVGDSGDAEIVVSRGPSESPLCILSDTCIVVDRHQKNGSHVHLDRPNRLRPIPRHRQRRKPWDR
jgi:hypothetical protein